MKDRFEEIKEKLNPKIDADKEWFLSMLDGEKQRAYEEDHLAALLTMLKIAYVGKIKRNIEELKKEVAAIREKEEYAAEDYRDLLAKNNEIDALKEKIDSYKCFFTEPYFARMDVTDEKEGYNSYYIGKKGDVNLEIVDWRAPIAMRYYQKSRVDFSINEYDYKVILRRALNVKNGKLIDFRNEYLSVKNYLSSEEIAGRDEEILFDPFLRQIIGERKDDVHIRDIIQTIQEQQYDVITRPERESFVLQGCAGSGKTMILLHRLSYLMYNNELLTPKDVLVITPSVSFNAFIDELSQVLELQKVKTVTLSDYYFRTLSGEGIDLAEKITVREEPIEYLTYLYSPKFTKDVKKQIAKMFDGVYGLFSGEECRTVAEEILKDLTRKSEKYVKIKNSSLRVRKAVLGEMKENKDGGLYFTKLFRVLMSNVAQAVDFLHFVLEEDVKSPDYFFRQFVEFFKSISFIACRADKVFSDAIADLDSLAQAVEREIVDLRRYRQRVGNAEVLTYADRIERREELKKEISSVKEVVKVLAQGDDLILDFYRVMKASPVCKEVSKCESEVDVARMFYRETVKKYKSRFGIKGIIPSDGFALCYVLMQAGRKLSPRYGLVFIDEGQDIAESEYELLRAIHSDAAFNIFGDLKQNITPYRGIADWSKVSGGNIYRLNRNYRNTNEIVELVASILDADMVPIGFHGEEVKRLSVRQLGSFFRERTGLKAVIAKPEYFYLFEKRGYHLLSEDGLIDKTKINVMTVYESKGLEFSCVAVYDKDMTENERYIAYTRAMKELVIVEGKG